ncbi:hypothetical protein DFH28DRAFT_350491 [Melampsora americana]|nr:hypothetical protein DFH28DRAFT_350491 [Melampsora americana]
MSNIQPAIFLMLILAMILSQASVSGTELTKRAIGNGLYFKCNSGGLGEFCAASIQKGWTAGKLKTIPLKNKPVAYVDPTTRCKITLYTTKKAVLINDVKVLQGAAKQIDDFCRKSNLPVPKAKASGSKAGFNGAFIGKANGQYVVMMLDLAK